MASKYRDDVAQLFTALEIFDEEVADLPDPDDSPDWQGSLVYVDQNQVCGYVQGRPGGDLAASVSLSADLGPFGCADVLGVVENRQHTGIGVELMRHMAAYLVAKGCKYLTLSIHGDGNGYQARRDFVTKKCGLSIHGGTSVAGGPIDALTRQLDP